MGASITMTAIALSLKSCRTQKSDTLEFGLRLRAEDQCQSVELVTSVRAAAQRYWNNFWQTGGAIDLSGSQDPRWFELERRIVLSEYLTAIQDAGKARPRKPD